MSIKKILLHSKIELTEILHPPSGLGQAFIARFKFSLCQSLIHTPHLSTKVIMNIYLKKVWPDMSNFELK